jgi:hypothetical protein
MWITILYNMQMFIFTISQYSGDIYLNAVALGLASISGFLSSIVALRFLSIKNVLRICFMTVFLSSCFYMLFQEVWPHLIPLFIFLIRFGICPTLSCV